MPVDIVALEYLIHVDSLLFGAARALLNVKSPATIFNNLFASPNLNAFKKLENHYERRHAVITVKIVVGLGIVSCTVLPILFAFTRWDSLCLDYDEGFKTQAEIRSTSLADGGPAQECFEQQLTAQRCKAVFDNFAFTAIPYLDTNFESPNCGI